MVQDKFLNFIRRSRWILLVGFLGMACSGLELESSQALEHPPEARQFDFWLGKWDVNLRILQDDLEWKDSIAAEAHIISILNGKAILELWDSVPIKGFSLRYFDSDLGRWVLWLNWPGKNRSGSSSLTGAFRHGRGEFYSESQSPDGGRSLQRYTFSDVGPSSLRWDDAYSQDGGRSWTHQWIMEFSRTAAAAKLPERGGTAHTFHEGKRCDREEFEVYAPLVGYRAGRLGFGRDPESSIPATLTGYRILDGCAVLLFLRFQRDGIQREIFYHLTFNTYANRFELLGLENQPTVPAFIAYSPVNSAELQFQTASSNPGPGVRYRIDLDSGQIQIVEQRWNEAEQSWDLHWQAQFPDMESP